MTGRRGASELGSVATGWLSAQPRKGAREGELRGISDAVGDCAHPVVRFAQLSSGEIHSPTREICEWRFADERREPPRQRCTRERDLARTHSHAALARRAPGTRPGPWRLSLSVLQNGELFPSFTVAAGGGTINVHGDLAGSYGVVLFYRGSWCPYCKAQLAAFSRARVVFAPVQQVPPRSGASAFYVRSASLRIRRRRL